MSSAATAPGYPDVLRLVAPNPGPMTLAGTNTYLVGRDPAHVIDPGPADAGHVAAIRAAARPRGGVGSVLLTHSHSDHTEGVGILDAPILWGEVGHGDETSVAAAGPVAGSPAPGLPARESGFREPDIPAPPAERRIGEFTVIPTPGHAEDHVCLLREDVCFCGDLVLGEGSSIVPPRAMGGSLRDYMSSLARLAALIEEREISLMCPGHGPWILNPAGRIAEYREHRLARERALVEALEGGERSRECLLDAAWRDVPGPMRPAAAVAMQAHLEKLADEGRLPPDLRE